MNEEVNGKGDNNVNEYKPLKETEAAERFRCEVSTLCKDDRLIEALAAIDDKVGQCDVQAVVSAFCKEHPDLVDQYGLECLAIQIELMCGIERSDQASELFEELNLLFFDGALPHYRVVPIRDKFWWREDRSEAQIISETNTIALIDDASLSVFAERLLKTMRCLTREDVK